MGRKLAVLAILLCFQSYGESVCYKTTFLNTKVWVSNTNKTYSKLDEGFEGYSVEFVNGCIDETLLRLAGPFQILDFTNSTVRKLNYKSIHNLTELRGVNFRNNKMTNIDLVAFYALPNLSWLSIEGNLISVLKSNTFYGLEMKGLHLSSNKIRVIEPATFSGLTKLRYLFLHDNQLTEVKAKWFFETYNLQGLDVSINLIESVDIESFRALTSLKFLNLASNRIHTVWPNTFEDLDHLQYLYLINNQLESFRSDTHLEALEEVELSFNRLQHLDVHFLDNLKSLKVVDVMHNPLKCSCLDEISKWAHRKNVTINFLAKYFWSPGRDYPICVASRDAGEKCTSAFDKEAVDWYVKHMEDYKIIGNRLNKLLPHYEFIYIKMKLDVEEVLT